MDILRLVWMLIGSEIVSLNYAASDKSPLCSGASQFAAGYAAAQLRAAPLALCLGLTMKCKSTGILRWPDYPDYTLTRFENKKV